MVEVFLVLATEVIPAGEPLLI